MAAKVVEWTGKAALIELKRYASVRGSLPKFPTLMCEYIEKDLNRIPEWIIVKDKKPELNTPVLIYNPKFKEISVACLRRSETTRKLYWQSIDYDPCCCDFDAVSHWMPLPEPPKV